MINEIHKLENIIIDLSDKRVGKWPSGLAAKVWQTILQEIDRVYGRQFEDLHDFLIDFKSMQSYFEKPSPIKFYWHFHEDLGGFTDLLDYPGQKGVYPGYFIEFLSDKIELTYLPVEE